MIDDLHNKYRPDDFDIVLGNKTVTDSLKDYAKDKSFPHSILFEGIAGGGKTTLSRIVAKELGCSPANLIEIDAASYSGKDDMKAVAEGLAYRGFGDNPTKVVILDEAHRITGHGWDSLLKIIEEPPEHVYFILCTTNSQKIPKTIKTRCTIFTLREIEHEELTDLVTFVAEEEQIDLTEKALATIAQEAWGSPRKALTLLSRCRACTTLAEVHEALQAPSEDGDVIDFCRFLMNANNDTTWKVVIRNLEPLKDLENESVRIVVLAYFSKVLTGNRVSDAHLERGITILDAFSKPFISHEKMAPIILATAQIFFGDSE